MSHISKRMRCTYSVGKSYYDKIPNDFIELVQNIVASAVYIDRGASMFDFKMIAISQFSQYFHYQIDLYFDSKLISFRV